LARGIDTTLTINITKDEWLKLVPELEFLLKKCYGGDLDDSLPQIQMQVPNTLCLLASLLQYSKQFTELCKEIQTVKSL